MMNMAIIAEAFLKRYHNSTLLNSFNTKILNDIIDCKTKALGGHLLACPRCGTIKATYNSCGNRNCPLCGGLKREKWALQRKNEALNVPYYHVVFTVPHEINTLFLSSPKQLYSLLFSAAWETIDLFAKDSKYLGARAAMVAVLHTWGQNISLHPHLHCLVPGGGITRQGKWRDMKKSQGKFLFPVKAMSKVYKAKFLAGVCNLIKSKKIKRPDHPNVFDWINQQYNKKWVVFAKKPMPKGADVVEYLSRYTHKVAIGNSRIKAMENDMVRFSYFDYKTSKSGEMDLPLHEFVRRFLLHILPKRFMKVRYYGFMANRNKKHSLASLSIQVGKADNRAKPIDGLP